MADQNWFLIIIIIVVAVLVLGVNVYVLIHYQHPEDRNQAWFPKLVVILGLSIVYWSVLLLPLDVANRAACDQEIVVSACDLTLPMEELWYFVYLTNAALVALVIPFTIFYYDADEDYSCLGRIWSALQWTLMTIVVLGLILGIAYGFAGYADFEVTRLGSGFQSLAEAAVVTDPTCIPVLDGVEQGIEICNADLSGSWPEWWPATEDWSVRVTFPVYVIAISSVVGWVLFMVFAGVGFIALPLDLILAFFYRPKATITKSEFLERAGKIAKRAKAIKAKASALHKQEKSGDKGRKFRREVKELNVEMVQLEDDEIALNEVFPQGDEADTKWAFTVVGYILSFFLGILCFGLSLSWILQVILYQLLDPPASPFLNNLFIDLDDIWGLFGTLAFAIYCFYLIAAAFKVRALLRLSTGTVRKLVLINISCAGQCEGWAQVFAPSGSPDACRWDADVFIPIQCRPVALKYSCCNPVLRGRV